jgi:hypothetical protein
MKLFFKLLAFGVALCATTFFACKNESKPAADAPATGATTPSTPPPDSKPGFYLYAVGVDNLNLREQPNKNAKVVAQFAEGEFVEGTGETSTNKEEVSLRGIPYNEQYVKVISTTPQQHAGWAYGGALNLVYAGERANSPDLGKLSQLTLFLKTLNAKKLESGKKAWDYARQHFATANGTLADAACILLADFMFHMEAEGGFYTLTEKIQWAQDDYDAVSADKFDMNKYPLTKSLAENGFRLAAAEGSIFPIADQSKLAEFFAPKATASMRQYLEQVAFEQKNPSMDDAAIVVPLEQMAERAIFWERFNQQNPHFLRAAETREAERWMRLSLIMGESNTPAFDYETATVSDDFKRVWADILQKYPGSKLAALVKEISDLCAAEGGKRSKKVEDFLGEQMERSLN